MLTKSSWMDIQLFCIFGIHTQIFSIKIFLKIDRSRSSREVWINGKNWGVEGRRSFVVFYFVCEVVRWFDEIYFSSFFELLCISKIVMEMWEVVILKIFWGGEKRKMGSYFKITVNLPVWATMGQFSLIMPRFFVCFSLKDIILWLGFYGVKKTF